MGSICCGKDDCPECAILRARVEKLEKMKDAATDATEKVQPAPAPLPEEVGFLQVIIDGKASGRMSEWPQLVPACRAALAHITDLTRRLAEAEAACAEYKECVYSTNRENSLYEEMRVEDKRTIEESDTRAEAAEAQRDEANAAAHCNKAAFEEQAAQLLAEEARVRELEAALRGCKAFKDEAEAERDAMSRALFDEQQAHAQTTRVLVEEIQALKRENALIADSYKRAHDEVILLRRQLYNAGGAS